MFRTLKMLCATLALSSLISCAKNTTETAPAVVGEYCLIAKGITYAEQHPGDVEDSTNKYDSTDTVKQVKDHNLAYERTCPTVR